MTIFGVTMVNSDGTYNGRDTDTIIGVNKYDVLKEAYQAYENAYTEYEDIIEKDLSEFLDDMLFLEYMDRGDIVVIQCIDKHIQFEPWKREV